jgi:hypothetical protein
MELVSRHGQAPYGPDVDSQGHSPGLPGMAHRASRVRLVDDLGVAVMASLSTSEWAEVFGAGWEAIPSKHEPAANALAIALVAMQGKCLEIAERPLSERLGR